MPRGQERQITGGGIDPYVQQSMQQNKQLAENRLVSAMQQSGENKRTAVREQGATQRANIQAQNQRAMMAAQSEQEDKRVAEAERARRDDQKYAQTMAEASREFQAQQAQLDREQQMAIIQGDQKEKRRIEEKREALRRFNIEMSMDAQERNSNAMLSILKGGMKRESTIEKAKTTLQREAEKFDRDKEVYNKTKERVAESINLDKRMDGPVPESVWQTYKREATPSSLGDVLTPVRGLYRTGKAIIADKANPMAVLQDQVSKYGSSVSVEDLTPDKINLTEDRIQKGEVKTEDINKTLGVIEGMLDSISQRRSSAKSETKEADFWGDTYLSIAAMRDSLEGLANSKKKIEGSDTETVGSRVRYALGTVYNSSLGGRASRLKELTDGNFDNVFEEMTKSLQVPKLYEISPGMNQHDIEIRTWFNNYLTSRYPEIGGE
jgi:hypothetical protein